MDYLPWIIAVVAAYLCGSIPFGLLIGRMRGVDIRQHGSKNIGATNCGRVCGRTWGLTAFVLDVVKGFVPVHLTWWLLVRPEAGAGGAVSLAIAWGWLGVAVAGVVGHVLPVWLKFRGGKGVATGFGVILAIWPYLTVPALAALVTWLLFASCLRYVSLASIMAALSLLYWFGLAVWVRRWPVEQVWPFGLIISLMVIVVIVRHRANLARLIAGAESRLGG